VCGSPLIFSMSSTGTVHGLCLDGTWLPGPGPPNRPRALRWTRRRFQSASTHPHRVNGPTAAGRSTGPNDHSAESPRGRRFSKIAHGPWMDEDWGTDRETRKGSYGGVALAIRDRSPIELLLSIGGVTVVRLMLPDSQRYGSSLSLWTCLVTVGGALFASSRYPGETLLSLAPGAGISGAAWGYKQVTHGGSTNRQSDHAVGTPERAGWKIVYTGVLHWVKCGRQLGMPQKPSGRGGAARGSKNLHQAERDET